MPEPGQRKSGGGGSGDADAHIADATDAHDASAISFTPNGSIAATDVQTAIQEVRDEAGGGGAPTTVDYLVGTADGGLSNEIVVGTSPGGELGGTWASPTVDATHAGTTHSAATDTHIADSSAAHAASAISADSTTLVGTGTTVQAVFEELDDAIVALAAPAYIVTTATGTLAGEVLNLEHVSFTVLGDLTTGLGASRWYNDTGRTLTFVSVRATAQTAPTGQDIIVDVNMDGTTIMTGTKVVIADGTNTVEQTTFSTTTVADGHYVSADVDQVGSTGHGGSLSITVWMSG
jgi:hypothetical protein